MVTIKGATITSGAGAVVYKNGWQEVDGKTYYFRSWGGIYKDTYIDGYYVDKNGVRRNSKNICVAIDAGHQRRGNSEKEPIGPGSSTYKAKVASGTCGVATGINEYELNLAVSLKVRDILEERGYDVYMIRETHDVNISNSERAKLAAQNGADILVRVHANGDSNQSVYGALTMAPSSRNTYLSGDVVSKSGHVWIVIGQCSDGSVVVIHATPPYIQLGGTVSSTGSINSEAIELANEYMKMYYPVAYERYGVKVLDRSYLTGVNHFTWSSSILSDSEGYRRKKPAEILNDLFQ